jgi:hypothetical protein
MNLQNLESFVPVNLHGTFDGICSEQRRSRDECRVAKMHQHYEGTAENNDERV